MFITVNHLAAMAPLLASSLHCC